MLVGTTKYSSIIKRRFCQITSSGIGIGRIFARINKQSPIIIIIHSLKSAEDFKNNFRSSTTELDNPANKLGLDRLAERSPIIDRYERQITTSLSNFIAGL